MMNGLLFRTSGWHIEDLFAPGRADKNDQRAQKVKLLEIGRQLKIYFRKNPPAANDPMRHLDFEAMFPEVNERTGYAQLCVPKKIGHQVGFDDQTKSRDWLVGFSKKHGGTGHEFVAWFW